jgi:hypothetical protein
MAQSRYDQEIEKWGALTDRELLTKLTKERKAGRWVWNYVQGRRLCKLAGVPVPSWMCSGCYSISNFDKLLEMAKRRLK